MSNSTRVMGRPRRAWTPTAHALAAVVATSALLSLVACSGSPSAAGSGGSSQASGSASSKTLAYAGCMRSHGVPSFPDPGSNGDFNKTTLQQLATGSSEYQTANQACGHLLPAGGPTAAEVRQEWNGMLSFARCMRAHGVLNWPDPVPYPPYPNDPTFILPASIQPIPQTISTVDECLRLVPNNEVVGHIDNDNWQTAQEQIAGQ